MLTKFGSRPRGWYNVTVNEPETITLVPAAHAAEASILQGRAGPVGARS